MSENLKKFKEGNKDITEYRNDDGKLHRDSDEPARIVENKDGTFEKEYYRDGKLREGDLPGKETMYYGENSLCLEKEYYKDGKHREGDLPGVVTVDEYGGGSKEQYYKDGNINRILWKRYGKTIKEEDISNNGIEKENWQDRIKKEDDKDKRLER